MPSLFATFDPQSWLAINFNWWFLPFLFIWLTRINARLCSSSGPLKVFLRKIPAEVNAAITHVALLSVLTPILRICLLISLINVTGLLPFTFTLSAHFSLRASLALPLWIGHLLLSVRSLPNLFCAHLVPTGAPRALVPFIVIIELVRSIIRPLTLAVRLAANIIAGHLLICLLGHSLTPTPSLLIVVALRAILTLCLLERAVRIIQAYVFRLLSALYINEVQRPRL